MGNLILNLTTTTNQGLHDFVLQQVLGRFTKPGELAIDLGAGSGAFAVRMSGLGLNVRAADLNAKDYGADLPFVQIDLNQADFARELGVGTYGLVMAIEVLEHVESPIGFLRNIGRLLKPGGVAVLTTPNVDNAPARVKFLLSGKIRMMDEHSEPTHISPIFWDLFLRQFLSRADLELVEHLVFPPRGFLNTRAAYTWVFRALARLLGGSCLEGDNHILVLKPRRQDA